MLVRELALALQGEAWAVNRVIFGLTDVRDDEDRPLNERRAPALARQRVPTDMRACPYHDERKGEPMNVSALAQATRHLDAVVSDLTRFRSMLPEDGGWDPTLTTVLDALSAPGLFLLRNPQASGVPAQLAVSHKVAAGFYAALRRLLELEVREAVAVSPEGFLEFVRRERLLIGPREACAGPPNMIRRLTEVIMRRAAPHAEPDEPRIAIASALGAQVQLGVAWSIYDQAAEQAFFQDWLASSRLQPKNDFVRRKLAERGRDLGESTRPAQPWHAVLALPRSLPAEWAEPIRLSVTGGHLDAPTKSVALDAICGVLAAHDGAVQLASSDLVRPFASRMADYLTTYRAFARAFWHVEHALRSRLGVAVQGPLELHGSVFGKARTLEWHSAVSGHGLATTPYDGCPVVLRNQHRAVEVLPALPAAALSAAEAALA
jgi:hypothetical protein